MEFVGPKVGKELKLIALKAVIFSLLAMLHTYGLDFQDGSLGWEHWLLYL